MGRSHCHENSNQKSEPGAPGIIIGFDVGLTSSSVSFALLLNDRSPEIRAMNKFTDQSSPSNRIPSIMYYDQPGILMAAGPSAVTETAICNSGRKNWIKVERFIMHLRPYDWEMDSTERHSTLLPSTKTAIEVTGDFLRYIYSETVKFIKQHYIDGEEIWRQVSYQRYFVFSLPNEWDNVSRHRMHQAAISGGLVDDISDRTHISFVPRSDASAFACLFDGQVSKGGSPPGRFILVDAGEDALQVMAYELSQVKPVCLKELFSPKHSFNGSLSINACMRGVLMRKLQGSRYGDEETLDDVIKNSFEPSVKWSFNDTEKSHFVRVGERMENDTDLKIQRGLLRITGAELAECFEQPIRDGLELIRQQLSSCEGSQLTVWLVGTLALSPWFFGRLKEGLSNDGIAVVRPDINLSRAVADGCVASMLYHMDCERETRRASGIVCSY